MDTSTHFYLKFPGWFRYLLAAFILLAMLLIRLAVLPAEADLPYLTFYPGIVFTMLLCGLGPGLVYLFAATLAASYILFPPYWTFKLDPQMLVGSALFIAFGIMTLYIMYLFERRADAQRAQILAEIAERRRLQETSFETAAKLASIIEQALDAIISVDADQHILLFNHAAEQIFGYQAEQVLGKPVDILIPERFRHEHLKHFQNLFQQSDYSPKINSKKQLMGLRSDGSEFPFEASISKSISTEAPIFTIILRDISERLRAKQALIRNRRQLLTLVEEAPISIAMFDRDMTYIATSRRWIVEHGRQWSNLVGQNHYQVNPDISEAWKQVHRDGMAGVTTSNDQDLWIKADGSRQWLRWAVHPWSDEFGNVGGIIISAEDITRYILSEKALKASEEDLVRAQAVGSIGSWRLDVRSNELTWSAENHRIFGVPQGTPLSYETFLSRVHPDDREYVDEMWQIALTGQAYSIEHRLLVDGAVKWVAEKAELEFDQLGHLIGGFGITQDITHSYLIKKQLEEANARIASIVDDQAIHLRELSSDLTLAEQRERDRLYELLHDHVQPMLVAARLGLSALNESTPKAEMLGATKKAIDHVSQVIQTARTLSIELNPPMVRDRGLLAGLDSLCSWVYLNHGLKVTISSTPNIEPASMTIRLLCFKVVRELLMNVVKHARTNQAFLNLEHAPEDTLRITLEDSGAGFDLTAMHDGSGIASIQQRLAMVGGGFHIVSEPCVGTFVTIFAPLKLLSDRRRHSAFRTPGKRQGNLPNDLGSQREADTLIASGSK